MTFIIHGQVPLSLASRFQGWRAKAMVELRRQNIGAYRLRKPLSVTMSYYPKDNLQREQIKMEQVVLHTLYFIGFLNYKAQCQQRQFTQYPADFQNPRIEIEVHHFFGNSHELGRPL